MRLAAHCALSLFGHRFFWQPRYQLVGILEAFPHFRQGDPGLGYGYKGVTFSACEPFCPAVTSIVTRCPSFKDLWPLLLIELWWTNSSLPPSCSMKPKPFSSLNYLTSTSTDINIFSLKNYYFSVAGRLTDPVLTNYNL